MPPKQTDTGSTSVETTTTLCVEKVDLPANSNQKITNNLVEYLDQMMPNQGFKIADQVSSRSELEKDS